MSIKKDAATLEGHLEPINHEAGAILFDPASTEMVSDNVDGALKELVKGPTTSTKNAIARYYSTSGKLVDDSKAFVQDGGAVESIGYVSNTIIDNEINVPDSKVMISSSLDIVPGGVIKLGTGSKLIIL